MPFATAQTWPRADETWAYRWLIQFTGICELSTGNGSNSKGHLLFIRMLLNLPHTWRIAVSGIQRMFSETMFRGTRRSVVNWLHRVEV